MRGFARLPWVHRAGTHRRPRVTSSTWQPLVATWVQRPALRAVAAAWAAELVEPAGVAAGLPRPAQRASNRLRTRFWPPAQDSACPAGRHRTCPPTRPPTPSDRRPVQDGVCDPDCYPPSAPADNEDWDSNEAVCASGITYMNRAEAQARCWEGVDGCTATVAAAAAAPRRQRQRPQEQRDVCDPTRMLQPLPSSCAIRRFIPTRACMTACKQTSLSSTHYTLVPPSPHCLLFIAV